VEHDAETTPGQDYRVELQAYAGPLDLLLYLVRRHEIDLQDIPMAELTARYLEHLEVIRQIDVERAGEFLVMASTLLEIKSAMLGAELGTEAAAGEEADEPALDPRHELVQQLLAYKRYKDAAGELEEIGEAWSQRAPVQVARGAREEEEEGAPARELDLEEVNIHDLCEAFARIMASVGAQPRGHEVVYDDTPIMLHAADIADRLEREGPMTLQALFADRQSRSEMIGLFLATLELVREGRVRVQQEGAGGAIRLELSAPAESEDAEDETASPGAGSEAAPIYDWPSEAERRRYERRLARRRKQEASGEAVSEAAPGELEHEADVPGSPKGDGEGDGEQGRAARSETNRPPRHDDDSAPPESEGDGGDGGGTPET